MQGHPCSGFTNVLLSPAPEGPALQQCPSTPTLGGWWPANRGHFSSRNTPPCGALCSALKPYKLRREMYWTSDLWAWSKKQIFELIPHFDFSWTARACRNTLAVVLTTPSLCPGPYSICNIRPSLPHRCPLRGQCYLVRPLCCHVYPWLLVSSQFPNWIKHSPLTYSFSIFFPNINIDFFFHCCTSFCQL